MNYNGNITLVGGSMVKNFRPEVLSADPATAGLLAGMTWFNEAENDGVLKFYNGTEILQLAVGGDLDNYLKRDGSMPMTGELELSSADQSASGANIAVSKGHVDTELGKKEDTITGAATTITSADLSADVALVSDASGKVSESTTTSAQIGYLGNVTSDVQGQIDGKQDDLGYVPVNQAGDAMAGDLAFQDQYRITGLPTPVGGTEPIRKVDFDTALAGLNWQDDVEARQLDDTLDPGAAPNEGDRYIITDIANLHTNFGTIAGVENNDIVEYDGSEFVVVFDVSADSKAEGALAYSMAVDEFVRFNGTTWVIFHGLDSLVDGAGLVKSGNVLSINFGAGVKESPSDEVGIDYAADGGLWTQLAGVESSDTAALLSVKLDSSTLKTTAAGLAINESGVGAAQIDSAALGNGLQGGDGVNLNVKAKAAAGIVVDADGVSLDTGFTDNLYVNVDGDTLTGELHGIDGTSDTGFMTKLYIDNADEANAQAVSDLQTRVANGHMVYDGTTAAAVHNIQHNFNNQYVDVTIVDASTDSVMMPDEITFTDENNLVVSFTEAYSVYVIITGANLAA